ncbi:unnamed protein product [Amoebophrya sp. A120]|nr:unnamed protein product [Amoebophrya sp. A120]|eukprot:GSA120T00020617001.1
MGSSDAAATDAASVVTTTTAASSHHAEDTTLLADKTSTSDAAMITTSKPVLVGAGGGDAVPPAASSPQQELQKMKATTTPAGTSTSSSTSVGVVIFGALGMLGIYVARVLEKMNVSCKSKEKVVEQMSTETTTHEAVEAPVETTTYLAGRGKFDILSADWAALERYLREIVDRHAKVLVVNCAGVTPKDFLADSAQAVLVNSCFPLKLAEIVNAKLDGRAQLVHISTDIASVTSSGEALRVCQDASTPNHFYRLTKILGEPGGAQHSAAMIVRTSFVGEEAFNRKHLLEWLKRSSGTEIQGYRDQFWSGTTCLNVARFVRDLAVGTEPFRPGVLRLEGQHTLSKFEVCKAINEAFHLGIDITEANAPLHQLSHQTEKEMGETKPGVEVKRIGTDSFLKDVTEMREFGVFDKGDFTVRDQCRFCPPETKQTVREVFHLADVGLAGGFLSRREDVLYEKLYPLTVLFCEQSNTAWIREVVPQENLFVSINGGAGYFYYSSTIPSLVTHFRGLADEIQARFPNEKKLLEIGCNDGVLLTPLRDVYGYHCIGVDPSAAIRAVPPAPPLETGGDCSGSTNGSIVAIEDFFCTRVCSEILQKYGPLDVVVGCNCLAHIDDMQEIFENIHRILKPGGKLVFEVHYVGHIVDGMNFDFIYHEHMSYYSFGTVKSICHRYGFWPLDIQQIANHGGSLRVFLQKEEVAQADLLVWQEKMNKAFHDSFAADLLREEGLGSELQGLFTRVCEWRDQCRKWFAEVRDQRGILVGYGASGRANTIMAILGEGFHVLLDDSKAKWGSFVPFFHTRIDPSDVLYEKDPGTGLLKYKTIFILAWPYAGAIARRHKEYLRLGGRFVKILPEIKAIDPTEILG